MSALPAHYYDGLNTKLLQAIPGDARRVLELGCANGRLGRRFKELHPGVYWHGIDICAEAVASARAHLDRAQEMDLDSADLTTLEGGFDTIVIGDLLEHLRHPLEVLEALYRLSPPHARIVCCLPNMAHLSVVQRLLAGDISYDGAGLLDRTHLRFFSPSSAFKLFLDAGWLPHMRDQYRFDLPPTPFMAKLVEAAEAMGIPGPTAVRNLDLYQMILVCTRWPKTGSTAAGAATPFSVIVPVNRPWQHELNIARSPGLAEVGADVVCVQGADSAAAAFANGAARAKHPWRVMAHQDVYFPTGSGHALSAQLQAMEAAGRAGAPMGFAGLEPDPAHAGTPRKVGLVIDRRHLFAHPASAGAVSMDELAVALHARSKLSIDPSLGWHLWATDLCLQAEELAGQPVAQILQVPLFHNSVGDYVLPPEFRESAKRLLTKYPGRRSIPTLCGNLGRQAPAMA